MPDAAVAPADPLPSVLEAGRNCWRIEEAGRAALIVDAADYFVAVQEALRSARRQVLMIGWDFDTRICLDGGKGTRLNSLDRFIRQLAEAKPELRIHILKWNVGALKILGRGKMLLSVLRWMKRRNIEMELDSAHPIGASHHQKLVVIDDTLAFCGGIDRLPTGGTPGSIWTKIPAASGRTGSFMVHGTMSPWP